VLSIISKFKSLTNKEENKELVIHSLLSLITRVVGGIASFVMNIVVARYLKIEQSGYVFLAITVTTLVATFARVGADITVLRFVSLYSSRNEWGNVKGVMHTVLKWSYIPVLVVTALVCIFSKQIAIYCFHKEAFQWPLFYTSLSMPFFAGYNIYSNALQGIKKVVLSVAGLRILTPFVLILLFFVLKPLDSIKGSGIYLVATICNFAICYFWWRARTPKVEKQADFDKKALWVSCREIWIITAMNQVVLWGGQFVSGIYNTPAEIAQLAVARTTTTLISFILSAINNVSAPRFSTMYAEGQLTKLKNYARNTTRFMTLMALPLTLIICIFPTYVMSLFGKGFTGGAIPLCILTIGQFISVSTGSVAYLLIMSGHEKPLRNSRILNSIISIILAFILTPLYGIYGSAISSAIALTMSNLMAVYLVKKHLGFNTMSILGFK